MGVATKRVYEEPSKRDGVRVLVDRLWPRGLTKEAAHVDLWLKDIAPSNELRKWYHERPTQWPEFRKRYMEELGEEPAAAALEELHRLTRASKPVTLLYSSKMEERNNATVLKELLNGTRKPPSSTGPVKAAAARSRRAQSR